ncbi:MAG: hypothetical protein JST64_05610 [Actinobacteria bacterium]|nr:hypothetical protein [Actinomycetota bacterium]
MRSLRGGKSVVGAVAVTAAVAGLLASCAAPPLAKPPPEARPGHPCVAAAVSSCALPFPSDELTVRDPTTATGRRLHIPDGILPAEGIAALGPGARLADVESDADGFSAVGPVYFEIDRSVDPASLPADGGEILRVYDLATGAPAPIRAELSPDSIRQGRPDTVVAAWPKVRWEPGHTYVARLRRGLTSQFGPPARAAGMDADGYMASIREDLRRIDGDHWSDTLSATRFTVRSARNATARLDAMAAAASTADHPIRNLEVLPPYFVDGATAVVRGDVRLSDFRDADGVARPQNGPTPIWEHFLLVLPTNPAGPDGAPVVVYGHGLLATKETLLVVAGTNAKRGLATIGIDVPNHGDRSAEGGSLLDLVTPEKLGRLVSMPLQGEVDTVSLVTAIRTHMKDLDLTTAGSATAGPDGNPDLDTTRILYEGTSMGGVLGAASVAAIPGLAGAFLQVPGSGIADILYHSLLWPLFMGVVPGGLGAGDAAAMEGAATLLLDPAENTNLVSRLGSGGFPLFVQYGVADGVVPNAMTDRLLALADVPLVGREIVAPGVPLSRVEGDAIPLDGRGATQVLTPQGSSITKPFLAHLSFMLQPESVHLLDAWLLNRLEAMGLTPR